MSDEQDRLDGLEREVEAELAVLAETLDARPAEAVVERVKSAVRCELDEAWLAEQPAPEPAPTVLERVRSAVRQELTLSRGTVEQAQATERPSQDPEIRPARRRRHTRAWPQGIASLAAAAMVAICVGIIRQAGLSRPDGSDSLAPVVRGADESVELFVEAADEVFAGDEFTNSILDELGEIEDLMGGGRTTSSGSDRDRLEFERTLDELLRDADTSEGPVGLAGRSEDGLG